MSNGSEFSVAPIGHDRVPAPSACGPACDRSSTCCARDGAANNPALLDAVAHLSGASSDLVSVANAARLTTLCQAIR